MTDDLMNPSCYMKDLDLYEGIPHEDLIRIANSAFDRVLEKGDLVYSPDDEANNIHVISYGEIALYHMVDGKKRVFDVLSPGSVFGNFQIDARKPTHYAEATRKTMLCITPVESFLEIVREHPAMMLRFMQKMSDRIQDYEHKIELTQTPAKERILNELIRLEKKRNENFFQKLFPKPLRVTHEELAALTGLNRVTVTRTLSELREEEKIAIDKSTGTISILVA